jgi:hypothetical protein
MVHNNQATESRGGGGYTRPTNLNSEEAKILADNSILVLPAWHLPHGWHVLADGYAVATIPPEVPLVDSAAAGATRLARVGADARHMAPIMQNERELELGRYYGPYNGQYNVSGRRVYWRWHDINTVLREHRYRPEYHAMPPARGPPLTLRRRAVPVESSSKRATSGILRYRHA